MAIFAPIQQSGKKSVADVQRLINLMGHSRVAVDGVLGAETTTAIWNLPKEAQDVVNKLAEVRHVAYPRAPDVSEKRHTREELIQKIKNTARNLGVNPDFAVVVAMIESDLDPLAESPTGASGLFQLTKPAIEDANQEVSGMYRPKGPGRFDVDWNITVGVLYLRRIMRSYLKVSPRSDDLSVWTDTYAAYNLGIGAFKELRRGNFDSAVLKEALQVQARYLRAGGPQRYLASVQSKLESVIA
jgi:soluble lytic murein transglycosylase-like protein